MTAPASMRRECVHKSSNQPCRDFSNENLRQMEGSDTDERPKERMLMNRAMAVLYYRAVQARQERHVLCKLSVR